MTLAAKVPLQTHSSQVFFLQNSWVSLTGATYFVHASLKSEAEIDLSSKLAIEAAKQLKLVNDSTEESA